MMGDQKLLAKNKKAYFDYDILEKFEAGIILTGAEVKALRGGKVNLKGSFASAGNDVYAEKIHIGAYQPKNQSDYDPVHNRKLLLKKKEIDYLREKQNEGGVALVPLELYLKNGFVKVLLGVCRGRKSYDKRDVLKKRIQQREIDKAIKSSARR